MFTSGCRIAARTK